MTYYTHVHYMYLNVPKLVFIFYIFLIGVERIGDIFYGSCKKIFKVVFESFGRYTVQNLLVGYFDRYNNPLL